MSAPFARSFARKSPSPPFAVRLDRGAVQFSACVLLLISCETRPAKLATVKESAAVAGTARLLQVRSPVSTDSLGKLIVQLRNLPGSLDSAATSGISIDVHVLGAIGDFGDSAVVRLVTCMGDSTQARATLNGSRLPMGAVCHFTLTRMAYYEAYDDRPEGPGKYDHWVGDAPLGASMDELRHAQTAWRAVVRRRAYHLL